MTSPETHLVTLFVCGGSGGYCCFRDESTLNVRLVDLDHRHPF